MRIIFKSLFILFLIFNFIEDSNAYSAPTCIANDAAILDLKKSKEEISKRSKELLEKETDLKAREQFILEEIKKLQALRTLINEDQVKRDQKRQEKVDKLIETLLTMNPKSAAKILSQLDEDLAAEIMFQMSTDKLAKLMNLIDTKKASELSERLAGLVRARDSANLSASLDAAATKELEVKGGEIKSYEDKSNVKSKGPSEESAGGRVGAQKQ
jgi:flagellar motility protein MotE (MotC chaperone)